MDPFPSTLEQIDELLMRMQSTTPDPDLHQEAIDSLTRLRAAAEQTWSELNMVRNRSDELARAQADAIVHSAEIIDELEVTRRNLAEARSIAEAAAEDTQRLADTIFDNTHDGVLILRNQRCVACNAQATALLGDGLVDTWPARFQAARLDNDQLADAVLSASYQRAANGDATTTEITFDSNGQTIWCEVTMTAVDMQSAAHVLVTIHDTTTRKEFERQLSRHRDFLNNVINAVPDHLTVKNGDRQLVVANDACCDSFGVSRQEFLKTGHELCGPAFDQTGEHELTLASGERRVFSSRLSTFRDLLSGETYSVATSRDITEECHRERRLSLLASVFNNAAEGVVILTLDGRIVEANPTFVSMVGQPAAAIVRRPLQSVLDIRLGSFMNALAGVAEGSSWSGKVPVGSGDMERWYWTSISSGGDTESGGRRLIVMFSDVTALENSQRKLEQQALRDNLTDLPNRRFFRKYLGDLIADEESGESFAVCFLDLDDFKNVNDSQGHSMGDKLLKQVARRLRNTVGTDTFVARFGGDEFAVIIPELDPACQILAETTDRILKSLREPFRLGSSDATIGVSIGVTLFPEHATDPELLMKNADIAMYAAKTAGKNSVRLFTPQMQSFVDLRHRIQSELRQALRGGDISLHFQPKLCLSTGQLHGCEALVRWHREDGSYVSPVEFIPIAEQTGLIIPLGELVLTRAAEFCRECADLGMHPFPVAVNISPQQIRHPAFIDRLKRILEETGAEPQWLELEITESALVEDIDRARATLLQLRELGIRTAIDDFGTGYSSLSYLQTLPIDTLKVDSSFVRELATCRPSHAIVRAVVSLGNGLGLTVVAEGVETSEQALCLDSLGCDVLQGFLISRPIPGDEFRDWLRLTTFGLDFLQNVMQTPLSANSTTVAKPAIRV
ncbi:MAG: EAL domain-containing protein [Planctomycetaceae bacterium]|nr:EAL domain-containing protein [Planctomycetaceae bacterium]